MEADVKGPQRKVIASEVRPIRRAHGEAGISLRHGKALPFTVLRSWVAPAGYYVEQWWLVHPETKDILYESEPREALIWGLQATTELLDEVHASIPLEAGTYHLVFSLGGLKGSEVEVEAVDLPVVEAA